MSTQEVVAALDSAQSAKAAGLRYVSDTRPGIIRKRHAKRFRSIQADGATGRDHETLAKCYMQAPSSPLFS